MKTVGHGRRRKVVALVLAAGLVAAACGGDDDDDGAAATTAAAAGTTTAEAPATTTGAADSTTGAPDTTDAPDTTAADTTEAPLEPISVSFVTGNSGILNMVQLQALAMGYFEEEGLEIQDQGLVPNSTQLAQTVAAGGVNFATLGSAGTLAAGAAERDIVAPAVLTKEFAALLTLTNDGIAKIQTPGVTPDSPIAERVEALRGLTIGISAVGTSLYTVLSNTLQNYGLTPDADVTLQVVPDGAAMIAAAQQGQIDGFMWPPFDSVLPQAEGWGEVWINFASGEFPELDGIPFIDVAVARSYLEENPEAVRRFLRAMWRGFDDVINNPDLVRETIKQAFFPDLDQALFDQSFDIVLPSFTSHEEFGIIPEEAGLTPLVNAYNQVNDPDTDITFDELYDTTIVEEVRP